MIDEESAKTVERLSLLAAGLVIIPKKRGIMCDCCGQEARYVNTVSGSTVCKRCSGVRV